MADDMADDPQQQFGGPPRGPVAGRNEKLLSFEYELGAGKLTLLDERPARKRARSRDEDEDEA